MRGLGMYPRPLPALCTHTLWSAVCAQGWLWLHGAVTLDQDAVKRSETELLGALLRVPHLPQVLHLSSGSH